MSVKIREIRNRYRDVMCDLDDRQMFEDLRVLLAYVEVLHVMLARQAEHRALLEAESFFNQEGSGMRLPN